jgi:uncharacterized protein
MLCTFMYIPLYTITLSNQQDQMNEFAEIVVNTESKPYRILSLDGGGAKGFYTLGILSEIEALTKRPLCQSFDLIFGTSTGAIIAALLAREDDVAKVYSLYEKHVPLIMKNKTKGGRTKALREHVRSVFGATTSGIFKTSVCIVATNWLDKKPLIFKNAVGQAYASKSSFDPFFGVHVADAVIASCSAYPFFDRHTVKKSNGDIVELADGGFCANNPTLYAIADATVALNHPRRNVRVLSLGVGSYPEPPFWRMARRALRNLSIARHATSSGFLQKIIDTNTMSMEVISGYLFKDIPTVRVNDTFSEPTMATDMFEYRLKRLNRLVQKGRDSFRLYEERIAKLLGE